MLLIIVRHGEAEPKSSDKPDEQRKLTAAGAERLRNNLVRAKEIAGPTLDLILSSPLVRARQTAEIASEVFGRASFEIDDSLTPDSTPYEVYRSLSKHSQLQRVMLVSHNPLVSNLLAGLLSWNERYFSFKTGSIAVIETSNTGATMEGVLLSLLPSSI